MYKSFDKGLVFHKDTSVGIQDWDKCLMTSMGTFDVVSVKGQGFFTDKAYPSPLTDEQIGFPFRYSGPITSEPNVLQEVTQSPNGEFIVAAFGNTLEDGSGIHISGDRGLSWHQTNLQVDRFEVSHDQYHTLYLINTTYTLYLIHQYHTIPYHTIDV